MNNAYNNGSKKLSDITVLDVQYALIGASMGKLLLTAVLILGIFSLWSIHRMNKQEQDIQRLKQQLSVFKGAN